MIAAARTLIRVVASPDRADRSRVAALLVACAAVDAIAAGILLLGTPLPRPLEGFAVAVSHGAAVALLYGSARARPSRQWLSVAALLTVPFVGAAVAATILSVRGRGSAAMRRRRRPRRPPAPTPAAIRRLGGALSPCDALECGDAEERRSALAALSRREDPEAIALLRRAAASDDPDLALSAAMALDEIGERAEHEVDCLAPAEIRHGAG